MGFIEYNANIKLFVLIVIIAGITAGLTVFYQINFKDINTKYNSKISELNITFQKLAGTEDILNKTKEDLELKAKREEDLSGKYTSTKEQKERLQNENSKLTSDLAASRSQVTTLGLQVEQQKKEIETQKSTISSLESQKNNLNTIINCLRSAAPNANC